MATRDDILTALSRVIDPELRKPVTELGMVRDVHVDAGHVAVTIALTVAGCPLRHAFQDQVAREVGALASGKGGVGKSSLTVNLAAAFAQRGHRVGVLDADVYGHSIPSMLGIHQKPVLVDRMMIPPVKDGLKLMSIGFFLDENAPVMWRGPMLHRYLEQMLQDVHWGELDTLLVDMPPGTGDVAISVGQLLPRAEAIVVTTPDRTAQEVAVRAALMAQKTNMRLLGVVENMSYLVGTGATIFGQGGGEQLAATIEAPLLGKIPLDPRLRECAESGEPLLSREPNSETAR